jgi:hypothetical protein
MKASRQNVLSLSGRGVGGTPEIVPRTKCNSKSFFGSALSPMPPKESLAEFTQPTNNKTGDALFIISILGIRHREQLMRLSHQELFKL